MSGQSGLPGARFADKILAPPSRAGVFNGPLSRLLWRNGGVLSKYDAAPFRYPATPNTQLDHEGSAAVAAVMGSEPFLFAAPEPGPFIRSF